jgi:hypothetical protein
MNADQSKSYEPEETGSEIDNDEMMSDGIEQEMEPDTAPDSAETADETISASSAKKMKKKKKKKKEKVGTTASGITLSRGVETMFRSSYRVQMDLTALADSKANIMITINGLILSIILASIAPKIDANPWLAIPTVAVLVTCVISIVYAVLAAVPRVSSTTVTLNDVRSNQANLLFFGNFAGITKPEYIEVMKEVLKDPDRVYHNMMNDIYGMGTVLKKKFQLLRISYVVFMIGIILGVALFIAVFVWFALAGPPPASTMPVG